jgi:pimeloyl-ACP methyl ester carboxylesterase
MFVTRGDATLFVTDFGSGPRTIFAHGGFVGSGELWTEPFGILSRSWRTVTYDHRGSGISTHSGRINLQQLIDDLFAVMDATRIKTCVLGGESMGAKIALLAVLRAPERFTGLVVVDGAWASVAGSADALIAGCRANYRRTIDAFVDNCVPEPDGDDARRWGRQIVYRSNGEAAAQLLEAAREQDIASAIPTTNIPTLIIHGSLDRIVPVATAEALAAKITGSKLVIIDGAGHVPMLTRPGLVAQEINDFFG